MTNPSQILGFYQCFGPEDDDCMFVRDLANASYMASPCRSARVGFWAPKIVFVLGEVIRLSVMLSWPSWLSQFWNSDCHMRHEALQHHAWGCGVSLKQNQGGARASPMTLILGLFAFRGSCNQHVFFLPDLRLHQQTSDLAMAQKSSTLLSKWKCLVFMVMFILPKHEDGSMTSIYGHPYHLQLEMLGPAFWTPAWPSLAGCAVEHWFHQLSLRRGLAAGAPKA